MAITYNGTPVTSVLMNGVTYTTIADENGLLYYACNPVCYYGNVNACYNFAGFEYSKSGCSYLARAVMCYDGSINGNGYICWVGGPRSCSTNICYYACMRFQIGCIWQVISGCGYCGTTYNFCIKDSPRETGFDDENNSYVYFGINSNNACTSVLPNYTWTSGNKLYSDWVEITCCDYCSRLQCTGIENFCKPVILPYCACVCARIKSETGYDNFSCKYVINPLGCGFTSITCSIQVC